MGERNGEMGGMKGLEEGRDGMNGGKEGGRVVMAQFWAVAMGCV